MFFFICRVLFVCLAVCYTNELNAMFLDWWLTNYIFFASFSFSCNSIIKFMQGVRCCSPHLLIQLRLPTSTNNGYECRRSSQLMLYFIPWRLLSTVPSSYKYSIEVIKCCLKCQTDWNSIKGFYILIVLEVKIIIKFVDILLLVNCCLESKKDKGILWGQIGQRYMYVQYNSYCHI